MRPRDRAALVVVAVALAFSALAIGGAPRWATCVASALCIASATPYLTSRRTSSTIPPLLRPFIVAIALTILQLLPIGGMLAAELLPAKLQLVRDNAAAWGDAFPTWAVASYDPPATLVELAKLVGYAALAYTSIRLAANRRARSLLAVVVVGVAALVAVVTLGHQVLGAREVFGVYRPATAIPGAMIGPLINPNHLASFLSIATPLAIGLAMTAVGTARVGWLIAALGLAGAVLLTGSRGGAAGLGAGLAVAVVLLAIQRRAGTERTGRRLTPSVVVPAAIVGLCAVILVAIFTAGDVARDLAATSLDDLDGSTSKVQIWRDASALISTDHWLGVGRGGFEPAFTPVARSGHVTFSHVENSYVQAVIDWGPVGAAVLFIALLIAARDAGSRWRHGPLEAGAIGGLTALVVHDVADFSIELPAVALLAVVTAAILCPARLGTGGASSGSHAVALPRRAFALRAGLLAGAAAVVALALSPIGRTMREDAAEAVAATDPATRLARARASMARHPADYVLAGHAAESLFAVRDRRAPKVIGRALAMNPRHGGLHHLAARMLAVSQRPEQATVEFAAAARWARDPAPVVADVLRTFPDPALATRALPDDLRSAARVQQVLAKHPALALGHAERVAAANPDEPAAQALLATAALREQRADLALAAARRAWEARRTARHAALLGRALALSGDRPGALALMREAIPATASSRQVERWELVLALSELEIAGGELPAARSTLLGAEMLVTGTTAFEALWHERLATIEERLDNHGQAEWHRARAARLRAR